MLVLGDGVGDNHGFEASVVDPEMVSTRPQLNIPL
jgi:hypothetical protein